MKEIYVYKQMFGGWKALTKEEFDTKTKEGNIYGAELEVDYGEDGPIKITIIKDRLILFGEVSDEEVQDLVADYMMYVTSITGMVHTQIA